MRLWELDGRTRPGTVLETRAPAAGDSCIIFIHGFNKDQPEAREQAETLFSAIFTAPMIGLTRTVPALFHWKATRKSKSLTSGAAYSWAIPHAEAAGRHLGDHLRDRNVGRLLLIGHSLGARVAVEAALAFDSRRPVDVMVLTGAAVPAAKFESGGMYRRRLATSEAVLWCKDDRLLGRFFSIGERIAAPTVQFSPAVGATGDPRVRDWQAVPMDVADHRYWNRRDTAIAIAQAFAGLPIRLPEHHVPAR